MKKKNHKLHANSNLNIPLPLDPFIGYLIYQCQIECKNKSASEKKPTANPEIYVQDTHTVEQIKKLWKVNIKFTMNIKITASWDVDNRNNNIV